MNGLRRGPHGRFLCTLIILAVRVNTDLGRRLTKHLFEVAKSTYYRGLTKQGIHHTTVIPIDLQGGIG